MSAVVMDGKALAAEIKQALRKRCAALSRPPRLAVVLVGDDPASAVYVRNKEQDCAQCGISCADHRLPSGTSQAELLALIDTLNRENRVIFMRRYWYSDSYAAIAALTGLTEKNVSVRLARVRKQLRDYLMKQGVLT